MYGPHLYGPQPLDDRAFAAYLRQAYEEVPAVRRALAGAGLSPALLPGELWELLRRLPVVTKEELSRRQQEDPPFGGWVRAGLQGVARVFVAPGPIYNIEGDRPDDWGGEETLRAAGFERGDLVLNTFSYHLSPASFIVEAGLRAIGAATIPAGTTAKPEQVRLLRRLPVTGFAGVPSYLKALLNEVAAEGAPEGAAQRTAGKAAEAAAGGRIALRKAWFTAEKLTDELRRELREVWGIEGFQGYGTAEVGIVAYECPEHQGLHLGSQVIVELLDPVSRQPVEPGQIGEVVVTPLRPAYPLLRLATGDLSRLILEPCLCGRPSPRLAGVLGRVGSGVKVRGMFIYPHQVEELASEVPGVRRICARVTREDFRDALALVVELAGTGPATRTAGEVAEAAEVGAAKSQSPQGSGERIEELVAAAARDRLRVRPDRVEVVPRGSLEGQPALSDERGAAASTT